MEEPVQAAMDSKLVFWRFQSRKSPAEMPLRSPLTKDHDHHNAVGLVIGKRSQQGGVDHAEDGGVDADAERQCQHGNSGEAGVFPEKP